jgi:dTDP-glucose 4,6-dehydratase
MSKSVLVTGADGFIGSHLVETLVKHGFNVKAFVMYNSFNSYGWIDTLDKSIVDQLEIIPGDIRDPFGVNKAIKGCEAIFHLAALIAIPYSYHSPATYIDTNVKGTLNILQGAIDHNVQKVIHTSTSEVYGTAQFVPITEEHPLQGQSPYSASKIGADQLAYSYYTSFDLPVIIARPFNTYGPRQSARAVIPTIITQIASGKKEIKLGSKSPTRDFSYVQDTADAFLATLKADNAYGEVINFGSNFEISIEDTANLIAEIMQEEVIITSDSERIRPQKSEVERLFADNSKGIKLLNWEPKFSGENGFKKGLTKTVDWFNNKYNLSKYKTDEYNL